MRRHLTTETKMHNGVLLSPYMKAAVDDVGFFDKRNPLPHTRGRYGRGRRQIRLHWEETDDLIWSDSIIQFYVVQ